MVPLKGLDLVHGIAKLRNINAADNLVYMDTETLNRIVPIVQMFIDV